MKRNDGDNQLSEEEKSSSSKVVINLADIRRQDRRQRFRRRQEEPQPNPSRPPTNETTGWNREPADGMDVDYDQSGGASPEPPGSPFQDAEQEQLRAALRASLQSTPVNQQTNPTVESDAEMAQRLLPRKPIGRRPAGEEPATAVRGGGKRQ